MQQMDVKDEEAMKLEANLEGDLVGE